MSSWWMLNPGPKRYLIPTIKKKIITLFNLLSRGEFLIILKAIYNYTVNIFNKIGLNEIFYLPYSILTYYNLINKKFNIDDNINFSSDLENKFFEKKLLNSKLYLEYGSGSSTLLADRNNIIYYSIESDKIFYKNLKEKLKSKNYFLKDFGIVSKGSRPILFTYRKFFIKKRAQKYAEDILCYFKKENLIPDLILIDGRYRVLCALFVYKFLNEKKCSSTIIIDDYKKRPYLHVLEDLFHIEKVGSFGVCGELKKSENVDEFIKIYLNDPR